MAVGVSLVLDILAGEHLFFFCCRTPVLPSYTETARICTVLTPYLHITLT